jgi:hypothetical protein
MNPSALQPKPAPSSSPPLNNTQLERRRDAHLAAAGRFPDIAIRDSRGGIASVESGLARMAAEHDRITSEELAWLRGASPNLRPATMAAAVITDDRWSDSVLVPRWRAQP